jgi:hypothetical protein
MSWRVVREYMRSRYKRVIIHPVSIRCGTLLLGLTICLLFSACHNARRPDNNSTEKPVLAASPNPVPAGDLDQPLAATQISWNTGDKTIGELYVKVNRSPERLLARGPSGTIKIGWIQFDSTYEFRLYAKKHARLVAKLDVTRDN